MSKIDLEKLTISSAASALRQGFFSAAQLADAYKQVIKEKNGTINAFLEVFDDIDEQAAEADRKLQKKLQNNSGAAPEGSEVAPEEMLLGIPLAIKDNILISGRTAQSGSKILNGFKAPYDATVINKLKKSGAIFLGRTNMDEFAMGGSNENSAFGPVKNPHDTSRVSGGSSGGSAASVAMSAALGALGSDTGGSVRQPASLCGVVGMKPTYGKISRYGLMAMGSSLDQVGPITKTVADSEILYNILKGPDPQDSTSLDVQDAPAKKGPLTIGVPYHFMKEGIDPIVLKNFEQSLEKLKSLGHIVKEINLPHIANALAIYYIIMPAEASSNLARFDGVKYGLHLDGGVDLLADYIGTRTEGFGPEVKRRIIMGNYILSSGYYDAYYNKAEAMRDLLRQGFVTAFETVDIIATPTSPVPAFKIGERSADPLQMYLADIFTVTANIIGIPAISVPSGFTPTNAIFSEPLPLGIQFMAPHNHENDLFAVGKQFELKQS